MLHNLINDMIISIIYKVARKLKTIVVNFFDNINCWWMLKGNNVKFKNYRSSGVPYISVAREGKCVIGDNFKMNNGIMGVGSSIGLYQRCVILVQKDAELIIGDNTGMSNATIVCHHNIAIGSNVKIGRAVCIYDTDFHSLDPNIRKSKEDIKHKAKKPVTICDNVFIGAQSLILKGVTIGENSIVGAGSVVAKSIPANQIWAGSPAKFIKEVN